MFEKVTPESCGVDSERILDFLQYLEDAGLTTHSVLMMKDDKIFTEGYWAPFDQDFCHRMYSQTKSFVGVAIGLLEEDGKLTVDCTGYPYGVNLVVRVAEADLQV